MANSGERYIPVDKNGDAYLAASHYGPRDFEDRLPSEYVQSQGDKVQFITFAWDDLPTANADDDSILIIPANSYIVSATLTTVVAAAGGTSYQIGLVGVDGTGGDPDGIFTAATGASVGLVELGDGATIGTTTSTPFVLEVAATGTFTAGEHNLEVVYRTLDDRTGANQN